MNAQASQALQQALVAASLDLDQRATAVAALRGADLWAATWPTDPATLRTLTNSNGVTALAVFTDEKQLEDAAMRYAWLGVDGRVPSKKLHMSEAIRFARQNRAEMVVVDIASDHSLELDEGEMELVSAPPSGRPPGVAGMPEVRSHTSRPPTNPSIEVPRVSTRPVLSEPKVTMTSRPPSAGSLKPAAIQSASEEKTVATFGPNTTSTLKTLEASPDEALLDALSTVMKGYPEIEWASFVGGGRVGQEAVPSVAVRVDTGFRKNLSEISTKLREASIAIGTPVDVLLLDTPEQMKEARAKGQPFYPWRKGKR